MPVTEPCPSCGALLRIPEKLIGSGRTVRCPKCQAVVIGPPDADIQIIEPPPIRRQAGPPSSEPEEETSSPYPSIHQTVIVDGGRNFPHFLHLILTVISCGLWLPVWLLHYLLSR